MPDWATFVGFAGVVLALLLLLARVSQSAVQSSDDPARRSDPVPRAFGSPRSDADDGVGSIGRADDDFGDRDAPDAADRGAPDSLDRDAPDGVERDAPDVGSDADASAEGTRPVDSVETATRAGEGDVRVPGVTDARFADEESEPPTAAIDLSATESGVPGGSTAGLLANVAISQGGFAFLLVAGAWLTGVPAAAFGAAPESLGIGSLAAGLALGIALYTANEVGAALGDRVGLGRSEDLREALAPDSAAGWAVLLFLVLPIIAGFEELLFRGTLVGAVSLGLGVSPWVMAVVSSVAFALGHGAQGPAGIVVTGVLGFILAAAFVYTGSLLAVIVAHYLVNALEFVVHEGFDVEWLPGTEDG